MCLGVKPALCLPPPKPSPFSGGAGTVLGSTAQREQDLHSLGRTKNNPCSDLCYQWQIKS